MSELQLKQLKYFVAIVDSGSFSEAAHTLFVSQPALSQAINSLENDLGFKLLYRTNSGITPTKMGDIVYEDAKLLLQKEEELREKWIRTDSERKAIKGNIRLVAFPSAYVFAEECIVKRSPYIYPNLNWTLLESRCSSIADIMWNDLADLCIGDYVSNDKDNFFAFAEENGLTVVPLCEDVCKVAISSKNPLSDKEDLSTEDAKSLLLACYSGGDDVVDPFFSRYFDPRHIIEFHSFERIVDAAIKDIAVSPIAMGITHKSMLHRYKEDSLRFLTVEGFSLSVTHCLIYSSDMDFRPEHTAAKALISKAFQELSREQA